MRTGRSDRGPLPKWMARMCQFRSFATSTAGAVQHASGSRGHLSNFLIASALTGVKKLTKVPSGSRNKSERLPQGIVVGS
jgi:hypothetical protein